MNPPRFVKSAGITLLGVQLTAAPASPSSVGADPAGSPLSPVAMAASRTGSNLFIACAGAGKVLCLDASQRKVNGEMPMPGPPSGLALSGDERALYVTCAAPESKVCVVDLAKGKIVRTFQAGHTAMAPVASADGHSLLVCDRFNDDVRLFDVRAGKETARFPVLREPVAADLTRDGRHLLVANHLHNGRADADYVAAAVSIVDLSRQLSTRQLALPNGSGVLYDLRVSPDGRYAAVTHLLGHFQLPATQLDRGWMNNNVLTLIRLEDMRVLTTVLLDEVERGAANPWGVAWSEDSATLVVAHAGTHEVSVINMPALLAKLDRQPKPFPASPADQNAGTPPVFPEVSRDLAFLVGIRQRVALPDKDRGPRAVVVMGHTVYTANYFSDTLSAIDLAAPALKAETIALAPPVPAGLARRGEQLFHDATLCFQGWQSCASCHPGEARVDGLNWDLLNDGLGNPKNVKSLLLAHRTPPAMSLGVRDTAETAVRAGLRHILFAAPTEEVAGPIDAYLQSLQPVPSPWLVKGRLSKAARRGRELFRRAGCADCHTPGLFTDLQPADVGTAANCDHPSERFDTPTLVELWRTAPYLHDGSAATVRDVLTTRNHNDQHGRTSNLSAKELDDLCAYLLSL